MKEELQERLESFSPFVITTVDGFSIAVAHPKHILLGQRVFVVSDVQHRLYTIPYNKVAHLSDPNVKE